MPAKKRSPWYATLQADRTRKLVSVTLSDEARELLTWLAEDEGTSKSEVIEDLIVKAARERKR